MSQRLYSCELVLQKNTLWEMHMSAQVLQQQDLHSVLTGARKFCVKESDISSEDYSESLKVKVRNLPPKGKTWGM